MPFVPFVNTSLNVFSNSAGLYIEGNFSLSTSAALVNGNLRVSPWIFNSPWSMAAIGTEFTVAGDAASLFNLVVYSDNGSGYPNQLLYNPGSISTGTGNAGTVPTGGTIGVYLTPTLPTPAINPAGIYWIGGVVQGVTVTQPTMRTGQPMTNYLVGSSTLPGVNASLLGYNATGITGAIPSTFPVAGTAGIIPRIVILLGAP